MASQKQPTKKEETHSQEPKVMKLTQHFEGLGKDSEGGAEDIGKYRQQAQQNSVEAIRAGEERWQMGVGEPAWPLRDQGGGARKDASHPYTVKARAGELTGRGVHSPGVVPKEPKKVADQEQDADEMRYEEGDQKAKNAALGELLKDVKQPGDQAPLGKEAGHLGGAPMEAKKVADQEQDTDETRYEEGDQKAKNATLGELLKDAKQPAQQPGGEEAGHLEGQRGSDYTTAAKDTIATVGKTVIDYTKHAAEQAKDVAANTGGPAIHYIGEKAAGVKDTAVHAGKTAAGTTAEFGKSAAGYAGAKVGQAKDVVVETGLRAAHYTLQKAVQATEVTEDVGHKAEEKTEEVKQEQAAKTKSDTQGKEEPKEAKSHTGKQGSSLVGAVGEALSEIAQTTKKMVMVEDSDDKE